MATQEISNLQILITDNAKEATVSVKNLADALKMLKSNGSGLEKVAKNVSNIGKSSENNGLERLSKTVEKLDRQLASIQGSVDNANRAFQGLGQNSGATEKIEEATKKSRSFTSTIMGSAKGLKAFFGSVIPNAISRTMNQFSRMLRMRLMRTAVKAFLGGITEGLQNLYQWSKLTGGAFASVMDGMATNSLYLKNTIGAAFGQLLTNIAPILQKIIDVIIDGINYINMFFAVLNGQTTYTRAKKYAVEYATAATNGIGGATQAVKDLKEELTVLDFDELHQLQEQATPSGGTGGGGGGGTGGQNYSDMFEDAEIPTKFVEDVQGLLDIVNKILPVVAGIGTAFATWKIASAVSDALGGILSTTQKIGLALAVGGFTVEYMGAKDIGKNGATLANVVETAVGAIAGVIGLSLFTKSVAAGLALGVPIAIALFVSGFISGQKEKIEDLYKKSPVYNDMQRALEDAKLELQASQDIIVRVRSLTLEKDEGMNQISLGESLLDKISKFEGSTDLSIRNTAELQGLVDAYNSLKLTDISLQWDQVNGKIQTNIDDVKEALALYKQFYEQEAIKTLIQENTLAKAEAELGLQRTETKIGNLEPVYNSVVEWVKGYLQSVYPDTPIGQQALEDLTPGDILPAFANIPDSIRVLWEQLGDAKTILDDLYNSSDNYNTAIEDANANLDLLYGTLQGTNGELKTLQEFKGFEIPVHFGGKEITEATELTNAPESAYTSTNAFMTTDQQQWLDEYLSTIRKTTDETQEQTMATDDLTQAVNRQIPVFGGLGGNGTAAMKELYSAMVTPDWKGTSTRAANDITTPFNNIPKGVNGKQIGTGVDKAIKSFSYGTTGNTIKNLIQNPINAITANGKTVGNSVNTQITSFDYQGKVGKYIQNAIQGKINATTANSKTVGGNVQTEITKYDYQGKVGDKIKGALQNSINATRGNKNTVGEGVRGELTGYKYAAKVGDPIRDAISGEINGLARQVSASQIMDSLKKAFANTNVSFRPIGQAIGEDIKKGIRDIIGTINFTIAVTANGQTKSVSGQSKLTQFYAEGGYPEKGDLFWANERGAEMVGTIGGRTAVANNEQIASALARALAPMLGGNNGTQTTTVNVQLDSATIARATFKGQKAMNKQYNVRAL